MWGDELSIDKEWPNIPENKTIRIFGHNVNGVSYKHNYLDWTLMLQQLEEYQVDIAGLVEMNLDLNKPAVRKIIRDKMIKYDKHARISMSSSLESYSSTPHKPGGTVTMIRGNCQLISAC